MAAPGYPSPVAGYLSPPYPSSPYPTSPSAPPPPPTPGFHDYPGPGCSIPPQHHMHPAPHPQPDPPQGGAPYMPVSSGSTPSALEYLSQIDQILIHQKTELLEAVTGFETCNQYELRNIMGQRIFTAQERSTVCARWCCGSLRPLTLQVCDYTGREVIHFIRPLKCTSCCFPCCLQELEVQSPPGHTIGYIVQSWHPFVPKYCLLNESREPVLKVVGPCLMSSCCGDVNFQCSPTLPSQSSFSMHFSALNLFFFFLHVLLQSMEEAEKEELHLFSLLFFLHAVPCSPSLLPPLLSPCWTTLSTSSSSSMLCSPSLLPLLPTTCYAVLSISSFSEFSMLYRALHLFFLLCILLLSMSSYSFMPGYALDIFFLLHCILHTSLLPSLSPPCCALHLFFLSYLLHAVPCSPSLLSLNSPCCTVLSISSSTSASSCSPCLLTLSCWAMLSIFLPPLLHPPY
ncbi:uncharacterized protein [Phyllobates terribilis]|uniref:uncharacterized protein isoform X1 n=1 Tax=Phyllobates terribilis TaxID=111132 RepID=UPI003CCADFB5